MACVLGQLPATSESPRTRFSTGKAGHWSAMVRSSSCEPLQTLIRSVAAHPPEPGRESGRVRCFET